jgi:hypothetical protein
MSTLRSMSTPFPLHATAPRNASSTTAKSGVKRLVSTGAMFSITACFASTSQDATMTAPAAPHGTSQAWRKPSTLSPIAWNIVATKPASTPPPSAIST